MVMDSDKAKFGLGEDSLAGPGPGAPKRSVRRLLHPLVQLASGSQHLSVSESVEGAKGWMAVPRFTFIGPNGGNDPLRVGIFAGIHGDEPEGVYALVRFIHPLQQRPEIARAYQLFMYPVCNQSGFEERTRHSESGKDLNREFWRGSVEPEVLCLESELLDHSFKGLISLHTDDQASGLYGFAQGATLTKHLIEPALKAAEEFLPRNRDEVIDGFPAKNGIIRDRYEGMLSAPPKVRPKPFEIILETPKVGPAYLKEAALIAALQTILVRYREFIAYASDL